MNVTSLGIKSFMVRASFIFIFTLMVSAHVWAEGLMEPINGKPRAASFSLEDTNGNQVNLKDYKGKFVLLNFWATWCAPCRKEMPAMSNLHDEFKGESLEVVGVHVGPSLAGVKKFLEAVPVNFTILIDKDMSLANWGVQGLPTTFLINPDGKLVYKAIGEREWDSSDMISFLHDMVSKYERMAEDDEPGEEYKPKKKSFFANFMEKTFGWSNDQCDTTNLSPN